MPATELTVLLADDEPLARKSLRLLVEAEAGLDIVAEAATGEDAVRLIDELTPDLVFLDIQMPGMFGHKVAQRIQHQPLIVFATAFDTYAMTAFELRAVDYLLKPYGRQRFAQAMERVRLVADSLEARRSMAGRVAEASGHEVSRLHVRDRGGIRSIPVDAVSRIESSDDYASIHVGVASYLLYARLTELAALLEPAGFVRIHRSHLINLAFLDRVDPEGNGRYSVQLTTGEKLPVSRSGGKILMAAIRR